MKPNGCPDGGTAARLTPRDLQIMTNDTLCETLENIARLLEIKGENPFKIRAYVNGARTIETTTADLKQLAADGKLGELDGIGTALAEKLTTLIQTGSLPFYDKLRGEFPPDILTLFDLQGLGAKKIKALWDHLGISSIPELEQACRDGRVAALDGFGEKSAAKFLESIAHQQQNAGKFLLGDVMAFASELLDDLRAHPDVSLADVAGSFRRGKETVHDLDMLAASRFPDRVMESFVAHPLVDSIIAKGATKSSVRLKSGLQCDLRVVTSAEFPFALNYFTGSKEHNVRMRSRALEHGWSLNEYRFSAIKPDADPIPEIYDESGIYRALGLEFIPPELRENLGEFDAAEDGTLPALVDWPNLRGAFHAHTTASDGRASLADMAAAAQDLGLTYLGITDHSKSSVQANGLDAKRLADQRAEIDVLNATFDGFRLFAGVECDILKDGSLDFPDDVLATLDFVIASVHSVFTLPEAEMTARIIRAMRNPYVTMLGHVTGRLLAQRDAYQVDLPAIIDAAAETHTIMELNASPHRLDLDWRWWPLAKSKGVRCAINPDAHSIQGLHDLVFGIKSARKGWLSKTDVINCLPLSEIESILTAKRIHFGL
jgi:DNA polymerase (family 10)